MNVTHGNLACWQHRELYDGDTKEKKKLKAFPNCQHFSPKVLNYELSLRESYRADNRVLTKICSTAICKAEVDETSFALWYTCMTLQYTCLRFQLELLYNFKSFIYDSKLCINGSDISYFWLHYHANKHILYLNLLGRLFIYISMSKNKEAAFRVILLHVWYIAHAQKALTQCTVF